MKESEKIWIALRKVAGIAGRKREFKENLCFMLPFLYCFVQTRVCLWCLFAYYEREREYATSDGFQISDI